VDGTAGDIDPTRSGDVQKLIKVTQALALSIFDSCSHSLFALITTRDLIDRSKKNFYSVYFYISKANLFSVKEQPQISSSPKKLRKDDSLQTYVLGVFSIGSDK
jgi:hypothetical protein